MMDSAYGAILLGRMRNVPSDRPCSSRSASLRLHRINHVFSSRWGTGAISAAPARPVLLLSIRLSRLWWLSPRSSNHLTTTITLHGLTNNNITSFNDSMSQVNPLTDVHQLLLLHLWEQLQSLVMSMYVCVRMSICTWGYLRNQTCDLYQICFACGSGIRRRRCDTLCTSGFVDDIVFFIMGRIAKSDRIFNSQLLKAYS